MEMNKKTSKLVFNMGVAKALLKQGCQVVDVKPSRENPDKTILVFKVDETFEKAFAEINEEIAARKQVQAAE